MAKAKKKAAKKVAARRLGTRKDLTRIDPGPRMSDAIIHEGRIFLAGQVAERSRGRSVREQTAEILAEIDQVLKKAGTDKTRIITANIWLSDISTFGEMNAVWDAWVVPGRTPARATVEAKLAAPEYKVEIMVTAAL
jgi:enamine deaminase RidA (YjgF/YER057c/UK114 family)